MNLDYYDTAYHRWEFHFLGLGFWVEVERDSRLGRFLQRRGI